MKQQYQIKIMQQEIAVYIIKGEYCSLINEGSKLESFKDFVLKKLKQLKEIVSTAWDKIMHFFIDIIGPKIHKLKNKKKKNINKDNKALQTIDIISMVNDFNEVINLKKSVESAYPGNNVKYTYDINQCQSIIDDYTEKVLKYSHTCDTVKEKNGKYRK